MSWHAKKKKSSINDDLPPPAPESNSRPRSNSLHKPASHRTGDRFSRIDEYASGEPQASPRSTTPDGRALVLAPAAATQSRSKRSSTPPTLSQPDDTPPMNPPIFIDDGMTMRADIIDETPALVPRLIPSSSRKSTVPSHGHSPVGRSKGRSMMRDSQMDFEGDEDIPFAGGLTHTAKPLPRPPTTSRQASDISIIPTTMPYGSRQSSAATLNTASLAAHGGPSLFNNGSNSRPTRRGGSPYDDNDAPRYAQYDDDDDSGLRGARVVDHARDRPTASDLAPPVNIPSKSSKSSKSNKTAERTADAEQIRKVPRTEEKPVMEKAFDKKPKRAEKEVNSKKKNNKSDDNVQFVPRDTKGSKQDESWNSNKGKVTARQLSSVYSGTSGDESPPQYTPPLYAPSHAGPSNATNNAPAPAAAPVWKIMVVRGNKNATPVKAKSSARTVDELRRELCTLPTTEISIWDKDFDDWVLLTDINEQFINGIGKVFIPDEIDPNIMTTVRPRGEATLTLRFTDPPPDSPNPSSGSQTPTPKREGTDMERTRPPTNPSPAGSQQERTFTFVIDSKLEVIPWDALQIEQTLGRGSYGEVVTARYLGIRVAVKVLSRVRTPNEVKAFVEEATVLCDLKYPHCVLCLGICLQDGRYAIVTEFMEGGDLHNLLHGPTCRNLTLDDRMHVLSDVAKGLMYLHNKNMPHRDIKPSNVLVDQRIFPLKLCDFGLSGVKEGNELAGVCTRRYAAPEVLEGAQGEMSSDVYSFGVLMREVLTGEVAFGQGRPNFFAPLPELPATFPREMVALVEACASITPSQRPSIRDAFAVIERVRADLRGATAPPAAAAPAQPAQQAAAPPAYAYNPAAPVAAAYAPQGQAYGYPPPELVVPPNSNARWAAGPAYTK